MLTGLMCVYFMVTSHRSGHFGGCFGYWLLAWHCARWVVASLTIFGDVNRKGA
jgi:hypothetical protein